MTELTPDEQDLLARIKDKEELRPFFFRKAKGLKWFNALDQDGYFSPAANPKPVPAKEEGYVNVPFWPAIEYLVATSPGLREVKNQVYAGRVLQIVRDATRYAIEGGFSNFRTWWQFSKVIQNIPPHLIGANDLSLFEYWLDDGYERGLVAENLGEHWLPDLLDRNDEHCNILAMGLLKILCTVRFIDTRYGDSNRKKATLRYDSWHAKKIAKKAASKVGKTLGRQAIELFRCELENILRTLNNDKWSSVWRSAIEEHNQNRSADDAEDILVECMRDALLAHTEEAPASAKTYVSELLESPFETIKRIAVYAIDQRFQQLSELAEKAVIDEHFTSSYRHEVWHLLHNHYLQFPEMVRNHVRKTIDHLVAADENDQQSEGATAYKRAIWLKAIHGYGDVERQLYQQYIDVIGSEPENPDFSSYMTSGWVDHKSPIPIDELLAMDVDALIQRLESYKDPEKFGEPGFEGLTKAIRQVVKAEPIRYCTQLHKFTGLDLAYVHQVLEAYGELWTEKAPLPWEDIWQQLLKSIDEIINQNRFWTDESAQRRNQFVGSRRGVVDSIGRLIENGTRSDEHAFHEKYIERARAILLVLLSKEKGEEFALDSDAVSISINSPRGRCLEALINLSLRCCRLADKHGGGHKEIWKTLEPTYNNELARSDIGEYEFATLVVNYLPNFLYMDREWVLANLSKIFDKGNYQKWLCAMSGYAYVNTVYEAIYKHLKEHGHFIRALDDENIKDQVEERIIQNIAIAFLNGFEKFEDELSLIGELLRRRKIDELNQLIWFLWTLRKDGDTKIRDKVFELWPRLLGVVDTNSKEGREIASRLCTWSVFIDEINENNKQLILAVVANAEIGYNSHDLLEMIARTSKAQPSEAYIIWQKLLESSCSDFPEEAVRTALSNLLDSGSEGKRQAIEIVSAYLRGGNERPTIWLKEIVGQAHIG